MTEEIWQLCPKRKVPRQAFITWEEIEKLQKEDEARKQNGTRL